MSEAQKEMALDDELQCSVTLIKGGLVQLRQYSQPDDRLFLGIRLLTDGLERFFKVVFLLRSREETGRWLTEGEFYKRKLHTHDLSVLFGMIKDLPFDNSLTAIQADIDFFENDLLNDVIKILSEFSTQARYHNINVIIGKSEPSSDSAIDKLEGLKLKMLTGDEKLFGQFKSEGISSDASREIDRRIIELFERLVRAIARLFTFGSVLGGLGVKHSHPVHDFLFLMDDELGQCKYYEDV